MIGASRIAVTASVGAMLLPARAGVAIAGAH
jgi:hypothetical protein